MKKKSFVILLSSIMAGLSVLTLTVDVLATTRFDYILTTYLQKGEDQIINVAKGETSYNKKSYSTLEELKKDSEELVSEIASEGTVLLQNKDNLLPLKENTRLSLVSASSVNFTYGGSGSGASSVELSTTLKEGLEKSGFVVNEKLWDFYAKGNGKNYRRGVGSIQYGASEDWSINECPLDQLKKENGLLESMKDSIPVFVLSRTGGEGMDLARNMASYKGKKGQHYLEIDETEKEILAYLNDNYANVILIDNTNNAMELGFIKDYPNIKSVLHFSGSGRTGTIGLGQVLKGKTLDGKSFSPSGHLVDTYVYDNFSSPASQNFGDFKYLDDKTDYYYYVAYNEGIYVGYRYYETRYEDVMMNKDHTGSYSYKDTVLYPFGYGLSYADFSWSDYSCSFSDDVAHFEVKVTNKSTSSSAGKEVVQFYGQAPYSDYDKSNKIEKSAVELLGFKKTRLLEPGESEIITFDAPISQLKTYDEYNKKTFILDEGDYYFTLAHNAHEAINKILHEKDYPIDSTLTDTTVSKTHKEMDDITYSKDEKTETLITNQFDHARLSDVTYLTRSNWEMMDNNGLLYGEESNISYPSNPNGLRYVHSLDKSLKEKLDNKDSLNPNLSASLSLPEINKPSDLKLVELRGKDISDKGYDELVSSLSYSDIGETIAHSGYGIPGVGKISMPDCEVLDGPAGLNILPNHDSKPFMDKSRCMFWPSELTLASTYNLDLARKMGEMIGEETLFTKVSGWYGPACNIHRTPFSGRNFEYYSEDPLLSGLFSREETFAASKKGLICFVKHCALNDQETHRDRNGLITWSNEQAIREIYLRPFEITIKMDDSTVYYNEQQDDGSYKLKERNLPTLKGLMTSYNRIGATWAGGNYNLISNVLRKEFGFKGMVLTDWDVNGYMDDKQMLLAGGDAKLDTVGVNEIIGKDIQASIYSLEAMKHIMYAVGNSLAMNGFIGKSEIQKGFANYKYILIIWGVAYALIMIALVILIIRRIRKPE